MDVNHWTDDQNASGFMKFMSRHLVVLEGYYESYNDNGDLIKKSVFAISGWLISILDHPF